MHYSVMCTSLIISLLFCRVKILM
ncbi:hypothetical protein U0070_005758 [Myodes glareolus]|uniref:NADH dehydrogenase subunit 6 n=1 Tax=Myodes glareolus TaxID=447135 RepID=A0AAW0H8X9_MYOGA